MRTVQMVRTAAVLAVVSIALCAVTSDATAGTYTVHNCRTPSGAPAAKEGWSSASSGNVAAVDTCSRQGFFGGYLSRLFRHPGSAGLTLQFRAPAGTSISRYTLWRSTQIQASSAYRYLYVLYDGARDDAHVVERCEGNRGCRGLGTRATPLAAANKFSRAPMGASQALYIGIYCRLAAPNGEPCAASATSDVAAVQIHRADITLLDPHPPAFSAPPSGAFAETGPRSGAVTAAIAATDVGSGVSTVASEVDGVVQDPVVLDSNGGRCAAPYTALVPCRTSVEGSYSLDTTRLTDGRHIVRFIVSDASGNETASEPHVITTRNGPCAAPSKASTARVTAGLRGGRAVQTVAFGERARMRGRVRDASGRAIAGARVCLVERVGERQVRRRFLTTDGRGGFRAQLGKGPSRSVRVIFHRPGEGAAQARVKLRVRAKIGIRTMQRSLRNGDAVTMRGRLAGRPFPRGGVLVLIEGRRGAGWQPFGYARARASGRYRFVYRFTRTTGVQRYRVRATLQPQAGYPYASASSRPVSLTVTQ